MSAFKYKTGVAKEKQSKQMYVYVDKWIELHNELNKLREAQKSYKKLLTELSKINDDCL
ncbi:hypothetical protein UFOVP157_47 [uncultured Caudovirales phage]|uniref:Uncharacterized protein n=1 Tax=uncultured Caudovirales phage TaxID=2100421 RepID=A0A6J7WDK5_9CAUD|nr:hypothetical protein UFOVP157_47 [uncultured Caudovirales phage]